MDHQSLFMEGVNLLTLGMGFVFVFLVFLVFATNLMSSIVGRFAPPEPPKKTEKKKVEKPQFDDLIAVVSAAIHHHRNKLARS